MCMFVSGIEFIVRDKDSSTVCGVGSVFSPNERFRSNRFIFMWRLHHKGQRLVGWLQLDGSLPITATASVSAPHSLLLLLL